MITLSTIRELARHFPGCVEGTSYGTPGFKARKKLFLRVHQKENAFVVRVSSVKEQQSLIAERPADFYITDHYQDHPWVLVRPGIATDDFAWLLEKAWRCVAIENDIANYEAQ